jgi:cytochrome c biogenesis protein CcdA
MKLSFFILFIILILSVVAFTQLNKWFNIKLWYILVAMGLFCLLRFFEIHGENKKRNYLVSEIRGGN